MIDTDLIEKIVEFERINGKKPISIYLGYEQIFALKNGVNFTLADYRSTKLHRLTFYGIDVYEVNENNHIGVG